MGSKGASQEVAKGVQPETASQRLGLSAAGARGQAPQVSSTRFCSVEWTSSGPRSNLEGGLVRGSRSGAILGAFAGGFVFLSLLGVRTMIVTAIVINLYVALLVAELAPSPLRTRVVFPRHREPGFPADSQA